MRAQRAARSRGLFASLAMLGLVGIPAGAGTSALAAPLEAYGGYPSISDIVLSPKGDMIAYATSDGTHHPILIYSFDAKKIVGGLNPGEQKLRDIRWAGEYRLLVTTSTTGRINEMDFTSQRGEYFLTEIYRISTHAQTPLMGVAENAMNISARVPEVYTIGGHPIVFVEGVHFESLNGGHGLPGFFAVDVDNNTTTFLESNKNARGWLADESGKVVAEEDYDNGTRHWSLKLKRGHDWQDALGIDTPIDTPRVEGISADGQSILLRTLEANGYAYRSIRLSDGSVTPAPQADATGEATYIVDRVTHRIIGMGRTGKDIDYTFFAPQDQAGWEKIRQAYGGEQVELISASDDRNKVIVRLSGPGDGVAYQLVDLTTLSTLPIGRAYDGIGPNDIAAVKPITYKAADGTEIPAYLTLPRGREAKNLPLVVLPHGGPEYRDMPGFDWWSQALASRGYAVLQPEFRGSGGYGWNFLSAGFGQWGRKMQSDLSDGVRTLAAEGTIDPKRVCIVGGSYGGYAALAGAALDPGVYRCAVSLAGISDLRSFTSWVAGQNRMPDSQDTRYLYRFLGASGSGDPTLDAISPVKHVDRVSIPVLLIHGKDDTVVPIEQSEEMADAMRAAGKDVTFVTLDSEDHWLSRAETRTQALEAMVAFLEKNNPP